MSESASSPSFASPMTRSVSSSCKKSRIPLRTTAWSSARRTRIVLDLSICDFVRAGANQFNHFHRTIMVNLLDAQARALDIFNCAAIDVRTPEAHDQWVQQIHHTPNQWHVNSHVLDEKYFAVRLDDTVQLTQTAHGVRHRAKYACCNSRIKGVGCKSELLHISLVQFHNDIEFSRAGAGACKHSVCKVNSNYMRVVWMVGKVFPGTNSHFENLATRLRPKFFAQRFEAVFRERFKKIVQRRNPIVPRPGRRSLS